VSEGEVVLEEEGSLLMIRFEVQREFDLMRVEEREQLFQTENR
jgi:hypothetical protein